VYMWPVRGRNC